MRDPITASLLRRWLFEGPASEASAAIKYNAVSRLLRELGQRDVASLYSDDNGVIGWVEGPRAPPSLKSKIVYYASLVAVSKLPGMEGRARPRAVAAFRARASALARMARGARAASAMTDRESASILPWANIVCAYSRCRRELPDGDAVLAALYLAGGSDPAGAPRRLDYNAVAVRSSHPRPGAASQPPNYIVAGAAGVTLVLREYKTHRLYGAYTAHLPAAVASVVLASLRARPRKWLVDGDDRLPITPAALGKRVSAVMARITGHAIGVSNLRKSYVSWILSHHRCLRRSIHEYAVAMGHSVAEQRMYFRSDIGSLGSSSLDCVPGGIAPCAAFSRVSRMSASVSKGSPVAPKPAASILTESDNGAR